MLGPLWGCWSRGGRGKQWGQRSWSTGGMSGGVEQADILSVLSLVKERWKVVSGVLCGDNRQRVRAVPSLPVLSTLCTTNSNSLFIKQCFPLPTSPSAFLWSVSPVASTDWGRVFLPGRASAVRGDPKIACIVILSRAALYRRQWQSSPRARVSLRCASPGAMWGCYSSLAAWHHFLSSKEQLHKNAAANPTTWVPSATQDCACARRTVKDTWGLSCSCRVRWWNCWGQSDGLKMNRILSVMIRKTCRVSDYSLVTCQMEQKW